MTTGTASGSFATAGRVLDGAGSLLLIAVVWLLMLIPVSIVAGAGWLGEVLGLRSRG